MKKIVSSIITITLAFLFLITPVLAVNNIVIEDRNAQNQFLNGFEYKAVNIDTNQEYLPTFNVQKQHWIFEGLPMGKYKIINTKKPAEYLTAQEVTIEFAIDNELAVIKPKHHKTPPKTDTPEPPTITITPKPLLETNSDTIKPIMLGSIGFTVILLGLVLRVKNQIKLEENFKKQNSKES